VGAAPGRRAAPPAEASAGCLSRRRGSAPPLGDLLTELSCGVEGVQSQDAALKGERADNLTARGQLLSLARALCLAHHHTSGMGESGDEMDAGDLLAVNAAECLPIHGERLVGTHEVLVDTRKKVA